MTPVTAKQEAVPQIPLDESTGAVGGDCWLSISLLGFFAALPRKHTSTNSLSAYERLLCWRCLSMPLNNSETATWRSPAISFSAVQNSSSRLALVLRPVRKIELLRPAIS